MNRKRNNLALLSCLLLLLSCGTGEHLRVRIEMPRIKQVNLEKFDEIAITNFLVKEEAKDFDLNKELTDYFMIELDQKAKKNVSSVEVLLETEDTFQDKNFWQGRFPDKKRSLLFTGSLEYSEEIRKAIKAAEKRRFDDPFPEESRIEERRFYALSLHLFLIDAQPSARPMMIADRPGTSIATCVWVAKLAGNTPTVGTVGSSHESRPDGLGSGAPRI